MFKTKFPKTYTLFYILNNGTKRFGRETLLFMRLRNELNKNRIIPANLTLKDVEVIREIPRDWKAVAPVMILAALPLMNYIILPLAYIFPQKLLCKQFWTTGQVIKFGETQYISDQLLHQPLLKNLIDHVDVKLSHKDDVAKNLTIDLIEKLVKEEAVELNEILELKPIFDRPEFHLDKLSENHLHNLLAVNHCRRVFCWSALKNLEHYAYWLNQEDNILSRNELDQLETEKLCQLGFERGINAHTTSSDEQKRFLKMWMEFSSRMQFSPNKSLTENNYTLFLHGKVLLSRSFTNKQNASLRQIVNDTN